MKVARVKAVHDPAVRAAYDCSLPAHGPVANQRPLIERQPGRGGIQAASIQCGSARRCKVLCALVPDIIFGRSQVAPSAGLSAPPGANGPEAAANPRRALLRQQPLNQLLGLVVLAPAETVPANA